MKTEANPEIHIQPNAHLWAAARHALAFFIELFGCASAIASARMLTRRRRDDMAAWLRPIEHLLRRLLLLEAHALASSTPRRRTARRPVRARAVRAIDLDAPDSWPAHFRFNTPHARAGLAPRGPDPADACPPKRRTNDAGICNAFSVAARLEALLRVIDRPLAYARRIARRLRIAPQIARALLRPPNLPPTAPCAYAIHEACAALRPPDSS